MAQSSPRIDEVTFDPTRLGAVLGGAGQGRLVQMDSPEAVYTTAATRFGPGSLVWRASCRRAWWAPVRPEAQVFDQAEVAVDVPANGHNVSVMPIPENIHSPTSQGVPT